MSLVSNISQILGLLCVSQKTCDQAIRDVVEYYKTNAMHQGILDCPMLNSALEGKLVIKEEYERLGPQKFIGQPGFNIVFTARPGIDKPIFPENFNLDRQVELLSGAIERLYK